MRLPTASACRNGLLPYLFLSLAPPFAWAQEAPPEPTTGDEPRASESVAPEPAPAVSKSKKDKEKDEADAAIALAKSQSIPPRRGAWSIGFDARKLNITPDDRRYKQRSIAPDINIGYAHITESWYGMFRGHLVFGPTSEKYENSPPVDFEGYGLSATYGKSIRRGLRKESGDYGAEVSVESFEIVGRSFRQETLSDKTVSRSWVMKNRWTAITPAFFATFLEPSRPQGNRSEWLQTRIEGYRISLGVVIPIDSSYDLSWERDGVAQLNRGKSKGITGVASLTAWLGI